MKNADNKLNHIIQSKSSNTPYYNNICIKYELNNNKLQHNIDYIYYIHIHNTNIYLFYIYVTQNI